MIFKAQENHILCLRLDKNRDIIAGSGGTASFTGSGKGKAAVIFESPYRGSPQPGPRSRREHLRRGRRNVDRGRREDLAGPGGGPRRGRDDLRLGHGRGPAPAARPGRLPRSRPARRGFRRTGRPLPDRAGRRREAALVVAEEMIYSLFWNEPEKRSISGRARKAACSPWTRMKRRRSSFKRIPSKSMTSCRSG